MTYLKQGFRDITIIPDKYNTGLTVDESELTEYTGDTLGNNVKGISKYYSGFKIDCKYGNAGKYLGQTIEIEKVFFNGEFVKLNDNPSELITFVFRNCRFSNLNMVKDWSNIVCKFYNCKIDYCSSNYCEFYKCRFGGTYNDGMRAFGNTKVHDSYFTDFVYYSSGAEYHTDGIQIYGDSSMGRTENIEIKNCRFENVDYPCKNDEGVNSTAYVNCGILLAIEHDKPTRNFLAENCIINSSGTTCNSHNKLFTEGRVSTKPIWENIVWKNIKCGYSSIGEFYYKTDGTVVENVNKLDSCYTSSVFKDDDGDVHLIVSNDTFEDRTIIVRTDKGITRHKIGHTYRTTSEREDLKTWDGMTYSDFPIDIDINVGKADFVVVYDTCMIRERQIRFVNYTDVEIEEVLETKPIGTLGSIISRRFAFNVPQDTSLMHIKSLTNGEYNTKGLEIKIKDLILDHTYKIKYHYKYTVQNVNDGTTGQTYIRQRIPNTGAFSAGIHNLKLDTVKLPMTEATKTFEGDIEYEVVASRVSGTNNASLIQIFSDKLPTLFEITDFYIYDVTN